MYLSFMLVVPLNSSLWTSWVRCRSRGYWSGSWSAWIRIIWVAGSGSAFKMRIPILDAKKIFHVLKCWMLFFEGPLPIISLPPFRLFPSLLSPFRLSPFRLSLLRLSYRSGLWIRIPVCMDPNPDPGGQKLPTKKEKVKNFHVSKCWMFPCEGWRLFL